MKAIVKNAFLPFLLFLIFVTSSASAIPTAWPSSINPVHTISFSDSVYQVQQGDTYYSLSRRFSLPIDSLQKWNGHQLQIGQTLYLYNKATDNTTANVSASHSVSVASSQAEQSTTFKAASVPASAAYKTKDRVLVVPFDPYLYFSDSDYLIARQSNIPRQNVRHVFRGRLNALLAPKGYETIHLMGGVYRDSISELSRIYDALNYSYKDNKKSKYNHEPKQDNKERGTAIEWVERQKNKLGISSDKPKEVPVAQDESKHFGVEVKDPEFFGYFNNQYGIDYYVFINQFEVKTIYENCLDLAAQNYERDFTVHYSVYDNNGELISGNRIKVPYHSNINDVQRIVNDNLPEVAKRILADLPQAN